MSARNLLSPETLCLCKLMTDDESILWQGRPQWSETRKLKILASSLIVIGMFFCILINYLAILFFQLMGIYVSRIFDLFFISIPLFILYFIVLSITIGYYYRVDRLESTDYFITPSKIIEMEIKDKTNKIFCINLDDIDEISLPDKKKSKNRNQTITFYSSDLKRYDNEENKWKSTNLRKSYISFRYVKEQNTILSVLEKLIPKIIPPRNP